jgi:hypothetical protein
MQERFAVAREAGARGEPLGIVIGGGRVHREKAPRVFSAKAGENSPPLYPP